MIKANFTSYNTYETDSLYRWDLNVELKITGISVEEAPVIAFSNSYMSKAIVVSSKLVDGVITCVVPNALLQYDSDITAHLCKETIDEYLAYEKLIIPVIDRKMPSDYIYTDNVPIHTYESFTAQIQEDLQNSKNAIAREVRESLNDVVNTQNQRIDSLMNKKSEMYTELWSGSIGGVNSEATLSKNVDLFDYVDLDTSLGFFRVHKGSSITISGNQVFVVDHFMNGKLYTSIVDIIGQKLTVKQTGAMDVLTNNPVEDYIGIYSVIGVKIVDNQEIVDARTINGVTYGNLGDAIRSVAVKISDVESRLSESIANISDDLESSGIYDFLAQKIEWEQGSIGTDGSMTDINTRIRTSNFLSFGNEVEEMKIVDGSNKGFHVMEYDETKTFVKRVTSGWRSDYSLAVASGHFYKIVVAGDKSTSVKIYPNEGDAFYCDLGSSEKIKTYIDKSVFNVKAYVDEKTKDLNPFKYSGHKGSYAICSYNVGRWYDGTAKVPISEKQTILDIQRELIETYVPDFLVTQEYCDAFADTDTVETLLRDYYSNNENYLGDTTYGGKSIDTNYKLFNTSIINFASDDGANRSVMKGYTYLDGKKVCILSTHIGGSSVRGGEIQELLDIIDEEERFILCGDFNSHCTSVDDANYKNVFKKFADKGYHLANCGNFGFIPTCFNDESNPTVLDNIITSSNIEIVSVSNGLLKLDLFGALKKDHIPFMAYVVIK